MWGWFVKIVKWVGVGLRIIKAGQKAIEEESKPDDLKDKECEK